MMPWVDCKDGIFHRKTRDNKWGPMVVISSLVGWYMMGALTRILHRIFVLNIQRTEHKDFNLNYCHLYNHPSLHTWWRTFRPSGWNLCLRARKLPGMTHGSAEEPDLIFLSSPPESCRSRKAKKSMSKDQAYLLNVVRNEADFSSKK